jgi:CRP-like cAMP-binding protein
LPSVLDVTFPFRFLGAAERDALAAELREHVFEAGQTLLQQGDQGDDRICLLPPLYAITREILSDIFESGPT